MKTKTKTKTKTKKIKNQRVLKNGAIAGYVYYANEKKWKWRIIGNSNKQKGGYNYDILRLHNNQNIGIPDLDIELYKLLSNNPLQINFNGRNNEIVNYFNNYYDNLPANIRDRFIRNVTLFVQIEPENIIEMNLQQFQNYLNTLHNYNNPSMHSNRLLHATGMQNNQQIIYTVEWSYQDEFAPFPQVNQQNIQQNNQENQHNIFFHAPLPQNEPFLQGNQQNQQNQQNNIFAHAPLPQQFLQGNNLSNYYTNSNRNNGNNNRNNNIYSVRTQESE
jgi:hypothetical protein